MENSGSPAPVQAPAKKKNKLVIVIALIAFLVIASIAIFVFVTGQKKEASVILTPANPQVPSKEEVGKIMSSVDGKIDQASTDNTSANAALKEASTPIEVNL